MIRVRVGVHMHSCRRILFICTVQSLYYMRMYHRCFLTLACVLCGGIGSGVCFSLFMFSACYWRGSLCFGGVRDRGFVSYISLFFRVLGWWVCVCLYTRVHTHKLLGYLMWAQVWDGHLESRKNLDRLKRSIHVDRIGVHSTFVYIYAGLRALMIWAKCLFPFNMSFLLRKVEDVTTISKSQSLTLVSIKDCTPRVPNETTTLFLLRVITPALQVSVPHLGSHQVPKWFVCMYARIQAHTHPPP